MTPMQFRREHGDPATWSSEECEGYLCACDEHLAGLRDVQMLAGGVSRAGKPSALPGRMERGGWE